MRILKSILIGAALVALFGHAAFTAPGRSPAMTAIGRPLGALCLFAGLLTFAVAAVIRDER
ncbi:MAG: hypothetical protein KGI57_09685 [Hyphomicrobiales bacterium]|nr:hypothetical protein [Hyphomicrobiales bacterium]